jgi:CheY-like chemotaxis protein
MSQTIMIGANDANTAYLLQRYAEESGFQPVPVRQSEDIVASADRLQPAVIILDIALVPTTAWEVLRRLKSDPATRRVPVVIYSCLEEPPEDWREGLDGFLLKSAMYDDFVAVLERANSRPRANDVRPPETSVKFK